MDFRDLVHWDHNRNEPADIPEPIRRRDERWEKVWASIESVGAGLVRFRVDVEYQGRVYYYREYVSRLDRLYCIGDLDSMVWEKLVDRIDDILPEEGMSLAVY